MQPALAGFRPRRNHQDRPDRAGDSAQAAGKRIATSDASCAGDQKDLDKVTPYVRGSPGCPTINPVLPDWVASTSK